jgi:hypothetical protein
MCVKTKIALSAAFVLTLSGMAFANDSGESHQDGGNAVRGGGHAALMANVERRHAPNHHVKSSPTPEPEGALFDNGPLNHGRKPTLLDPHPTPNPFEKSDDFVW